MKKTILLQILLLSAIALMSQDAKKGIKQYHKGNYDEAHTIFTELINVSKYNAAANFGMALLHSNSAYKNFDLFLALEYMVTAEKYYERMSLGLRNDLSDLMNPEIMRDEKKRMDDALFEYIKKQNDLKLVEKFVENCASSSHYRDIFEVRIDIEYELAKQKNTTEAFDLFIENYSYSTKVDQAKTVRDKLAYDEALAKNDVTTYNDFIDRYPKHEKILEIKNLRDIAAFERAKKTNTVEVFDEFIENYPEAPQLQQVITLRDELAYTIVKSANKIPEYKKFITSYPKSKYIGEVTDLALQKIKETGSIDAINDFIKNFNDPILINRATSLKSELTGNQYLGNNRYPTTSFNWVKVYDTDNRRDRSTAIATAANQDVLLGGFVKEKSKWYNDGMIVRLDKAGNTLWKKTYGGALDDAIKDLKPTSDDGIVAVGRYQTRGASNGKIWVFKTDANGNKLWEQVFDKSEANAVAVATNGDIVVCAYKANSDGMRDLVVIKLNKSGTKQWEETFAEKGEARDIQISSTGEIYAISDNWMIKLDTNGKKQWEKKHAEDCMAYATALTNDGGLLVVGVFYDFRKTTGSEFWITKINSAGSAVWNKTFDRVHKHDAAYSVEVAPNNTIYLTGLTANTEKEDDIWILKLDASGTMTEEVLFGTSQNEREPHSVLSNDQKLLILGSKGYNENSQADNFIIKLN